MKKVKYNFNGEIQMQTAYNKKELLDAFGVNDDPNYVDNFYHDEAVKNIKASTNVLRVMH